MDSKTKRSWVSTAAPTLGQGGLVAKAAGQMFSITSGESCPRVKFLGLGKAAGYMSPGTGTSDWVWEQRGKNSSVELMSCLALRSVPTTLQAGKEGRSPGLPKDVQSVLGVTAHHLTSCLFQALVHICSVSLQQMTRGRGRPRHHLQVGDSFGLIERIQDKHDFMTLIKDEEGK